MVIMRSFWRSRNRSSCWTVVPEALPTDAAGRAGSFAQHLHGRVVRAVVNCRAVDDRAAGDDLDEDRVVRLQCDPGEDVGGLLLEIRGRILDLAPMALHACGVARDDVEGRAGDERA